MKYFLPFLLIGVLIGCDSDVYFKSPQPLDGKILNEFPKSFQNKYRRKHEFAEITKNQYIFTSSYPIDVQIDSVLKKEGVTIKEDSIIFKDLKKTYRTTYTKHGDSILFIKCDTSVYTLNDNIILTKSRKNHFINAKAEDFWLPLRLILDKKKRIIGLKKIPKKNFELAKQHGIDSLDWFYAGKDSTRLWLPGFSKKQIDQFVKNDGFDTGTSSIECTEIISDSTIVLVDWEKLK